MNKIQQDHTNKLTPFPLNDNYSVSREGQVYSHISNKFLKPIKTKAGYVVFKIKHNGKKQIFGHRLVAITFIPNPEDKRFINHKNGKRDDNREVNLEHCTSRENTVHKFKDLRYIVSSVSRAKRSKGQFSEILGYISQNSTFNGYWFDGKQYCSLTAIAEDWNVTSGTASRWFLNGQINYIIDDHVQPLNEKQRLHHTIRQIRQENRS
jgi:hypothetical protein